MSEGLNEHSPDAPEEEHSQFDEAQYALQTARFLLHKTQLPSDLAEDVAQQALLRYHAFMGKQKVDNRKAYLFTIVKNEMINRLREQQENFSLDEVQGVEFNRNISTTQDLDSRLLVREIWTKLTGEDRRLFELLILDYRGHELARRLGITDVAARQRTRRLVAKLKKMLGENTPLSVEERIAAES